MLASVNYIKVKAKEPLYLDKVVECDGILIKGKIDIATPEKLGVIRVIEGNGLHITDGSEGIEKAGNVSLSLVSDEEAGAMSPEDKKLLDFAYKAVLGAIPRGTARFNGVVESVSEDDTIDYETIATDWEGVVWLCDMKMFVAYKTKTSLGTCGCNTSSIATVKFTYYPHWAEDKFYMHTPGEYEGLWKDKVYIYGGAVWVWANCYDNLVKASGSGDIEELTEEELDEALADFEFVPISGITGIEISAEEPLVAETTTEGDITKVKLTITEASEEDVDNIFNQEEE